MYPLLLLVEAGQSLVSVFNIVPVHEPVVRLKYERPLQQQRRSEYEQQGYGQGIDWSQQQRQQQLQQQQQLQREQQELQQQGLNRRYSSQEYENQDYGTSGEWERIYNEPRSYSYGNRTPYEEGSRGQYKEGLIPKMKRWFGMNPSNTDEEYYEDTYSYSRSGMGTGVREGYGWDTSKKYYEISPSYSNIQQPQQEQQQQQQQPIQQYRQKSEEVSEMPTSSQEIPEDRTKTEKEYVSRSPGISSSKSSSKTKPVEVKEKIETERVYAGTTGSKTD